MINRVQINVIGRVQGVFFRAYTQQKAIELGLVGHVLNQGDGSVFIDVQGEDEPLSTFIQWCKTGAPLSKVVEVMCVNVEIQPELTEFLIKR